MEMIRHTHTTKWQAAESSVSIVMVKTMEKTENLSEHHMIFTDWTFIYLLI